MDERTAALLKADGFDGVCVFVNDDVSAPVIDKLVEAVRLEVGCRAYGGGRWDNSSGGVVR